MYVFVLDTNRKPLDPCSPARARKLLKSGRASVFRRYPFTIIIHDLEVENCETSSHELKLDPGSKVTGIALLQKDKVIWGAELHHRGHQIKDALETRRAIRRSRRNRKTRYRQARFLNRTRPQGWLAPSLNHRVLTIMTWVKRLIKFVPINSLFLELVGFDTQKLNNPEISGKEYQQGTLYQYEVREYLLEKFSRSCAYCGVKNVPLEVEHIVPKSIGGSNRVSNLAIACRKCNQAKGNRNIEEFLSKKPDLLKKIKTQVKTPLKDASAVNSTRWVLYNSLKELNLPVLTGTGGQTKYNRTQQNLPKTHWLDAACVREVPRLKILVKKPLSIKAKGQGNRQLCRVNRYGFPCARPRQTYKNGFKTGDLAYATITNGKYIGTWFGRVLILNKNRLEMRVNGLRISGSLDKFKKVYNKDGYDYSFV